MTTSRSKAKGSRAERLVAEVMGGVRVGMDGGPVDVVVPGYANVQVKAMAIQPSLNECRSMIEAMPEGLLRAVVVVPSPGRGHVAKPLIVMELREWREWHGSDTTS